MSSSETSETAPLRFYSVNSSVDYTIRHGRDTLRVTRGQAEYLVEQEVINRCIKCSTAIDPEFHTETLDGEQITISEILQLLMQPDVRQQVDARGI